MAVNINIRPPNKIVNGIAIPPPHPIKIIIANLAIQVWAACIGIIEYKNNLSGHQHIQKTKTLAKQIKLTYAIIGHQHIQKTKALARNRDISIPRVQTLSTQSGMIMSIG